MTPDRYRPVDTDEVLRRVDTHARVGAALLGGLGEVGHEEEDAAFTSELVTAARNAAEHELADVAYDLARACLAAHQNYAKDVIWVDQPRDVDELHDAMRVLRNRITPRAPASQPPAPSAECDIRPLLEALEMCEALEGLSDRVRFLRAEAPAVHEQWDEVEVRALQLITDSTSENWKRCARFLIVHACSESGRPERAMVHLDAIAQAHGTDAAYWYNMAAVLAQMNDSTGFDQAASEFRAAAPGDPNVLAWKAAAEQNSQWIARHLRRSVNGVRDALGLESVAP